MSVPSPFPVLVFLIALTVGTGGADERPDLLFLFADDQCFETIRALGNDEIETPSLDRLVRRGTTFTHAYNMGSWSGAVCVASRHMLNTGAFVWHAERISKRLGKGTGAAAGEVPDFAERGWMWSQLLGKAGYDTWFTGKWHVGGKPEELFTVARHVRGGMPKDTPEAYNRPLPGQPDPWDAADPRFGGFWEGGKHWSEVVADDAIDFLASARERAKPSFYYIAFNAPHDPRQSPQEYLDRYPAEKIRLPENFLPMYPWKDRIDNPPSLRDERLAPFPRTEESVRVHRREYYALITHLDTQIGRILDALDASGRADRTWIFYSADHGLAVGQHGLMGKQNLFDHSLRVPLIMAGPGVPADVRDDTPVYLQDIMPTTLELAGAEIPEHVQFRSLLRPGHEVIYGGYLKSQRAVVRDGKKLILYPKVPKALLFDLERDPREMRDLLADAGNGLARETALRLFEDLLRLREETGDALELDRTDYPELAE